MQPTERKANKKLVYVDLLEEEEDVPEIENERKDEIEDWDLSIHEKKAESDESDTESSESDSDESDKPKTSAKTTKSKGGGHHHWNGSILIFLLKILNGNQVC